MQNAECECECEDRTTREGTEEQNRTEQNRQHHRIAEGMKNSNGKNSAKSEKTQKEEGERRRGRGGSIEREMAGPSKWERREKIGGK